MFTFLSIKETNAQIQISQQGQITDRYNAAITNLGSTSTDVRLGGIYALQRIMEDSPRDQPTVVAVLCAFIRDNAPEPHVKSSAPGKPTTDVQAALTVVARRDITHDGSQTLVDLTGAELSGANLLYADLDEANLSGVDLRNARLTGANLYGADLADADMAGADLDHAVVSDVSLSGADLHDASFFGANLGLSRLDNTNLTGADLDKANLTHADLRDADLTNAFTGLAILEGADLKGIKGYQAP